MTTLTLTAQPGVGGFQITSRNPEEHYGNPINATPVYVPGKASFATRAEAIRALYGRGYKVADNGSITRLTSR